MDIQKLKVLKNSLINSDLLKAVATFDRSIFPIDKEFSFPDGYLEKMYEIHKEGLFVLMDENDVVGYVNCIFLTDEIKATYLKTKNYLMLENKGFKIGDNNMYFYTLAIQERYRHTGAVKILMKQFCNWLNKEKQKGKNISSCISEAVTLDGIRTLLKMGMTPKDVNKDGLGIYYSSDCLNEYIEKMIGKDRKNKEI